MSIISKQSKQRIHELLRREYNWVDEEINELKSLIRKKRKLKESTPSGGEKAECWKIISGWSNRLQKLKEKRKALQITIKEIKSEY